LQNSTSGPPEAFYHANERVLIDVMTCANGGFSEGALMEFLQSTYNAGADLGKWDRKSLER